ncbi:MAG: helix-turn-helix transcriptional regulator [Candidatus Margulisbacteria bacterium]|nr:helix-turn-helix transcriptional regulator [Candidatus Margulisiibacteriota bacterium]
MVKAASFYQPNKDLLTALSQELKSIRKAKKLTIEQLSELSGLHEKYLQTIERDHRNMSISVFVQIAKALKVSPSKLLEKALRSK